MEVLKLKRKLIIFLLATLLMSCALLVCGFVQYKGKDQNFSFAQSIENNEKLPFDREQIKIDDVKLFADTLSAKAGEKINLSYIIEPQYAAETIISVEYKIMSGKNYASVSNDGILSIYDNAKAYENISVRVYINQVESNAITIFIEKTEVEEFEIISNKDTIREGGKAQISVQKFLPENASFNSVIYEIVDGSEHASINSKTGEIQVNSEINESDATITVRALTCENFSKESNYITMNIYVPVKNMVLTANKKIAKVSSKKDATVQLTASPIGIATEFNPTYIMDEEFSEYAYIEENILHIKNNLPSSMFIPVWAEQDGAESNILYIEVYILTEEIQLTKSEGISEVSQFLTYDFSAKTFPSFANSQEFEYLLFNQDLCQVTYASITDQGYLTIADEAPPSTTLYLFILNDDIIREIHLKITEFNTTKIEIDTENLSNVLLPGNRVDFRAILNDSFLTNNHFEVQFVDGEEGVFVNHKNYITIKSLNELENFGKNQLNFSIKLKSTTNVYSEIYYFTIKLPVTCMKNQTIEADRGSTIYINMFFNNKNFASNKKLKDIDNINISGQIIPVNKTSVDGQIKVVLPTKLQFNTIIPISVYSEDNNINCVVTIKIKKLDINKIVTTLAKMDSEQRTVNAAKPELWVNRKITSTFTYNGISVLDYGLVLQSKTAKNAAISFSNNVATINANNVAGGSIIEYKAVFSDGATTTTYEISRNNLRVFNPASTSGAVYITDKNGNKTNNLTIYTVKEDLSKYYNIDPNVKISNIWVSANYGEAVVENSNTIKLLYSTPLNGFDVVIHYTQTYNGKNYEVGQTKIRIKVQLTLIYKELYADLRVTSSTDANGGYKNMNIDFATLKAAGYTHVQINLALDICEYNDGWQEVYVYVDNDTSLSNGSKNIFTEQNVEHGAGYKDTSWWTHYFTFEVEINTLVNNPYIFIICGARGCFADDWCWGYTRIDFKPFVKGA